MNPGLGKFLAIFFAACFLALQFHPVGDTQLESNAKQIIHIEDVSTSVLDNQFAYVQIFQSKPSYLIQQKNRLKQQRQFLGSLERQVEHAFQHFMQQCLAAICQDDQDKLSTRFHYLQKLALSFEFNPILVSSFKQVHNDEPDSQISLS